MRGKAALFLVALSSWCLPTYPVEKGQSLAAALDELRGRGLQLIFSSALIGAERRVDVDPGSGSPEEVARRILAPHGLTLKPVRPGLFAVVKGAAAPSPPAANAANARAVTPKAAPPSTDSPYEIDVYASRYEIEPQEPSADLTQLSRDDIESLPGLAEDAMRVTRVLPGTAANPLSARTHVRGGREDELAVYFDGVPLFEPFHYKDVQSLLGILDPDSLSKIDFFSGVFPARYGNRLSGVLDIAPRTWSGEGYNAIGASLLYTRALSQGRLDSYPVEWLASVRRGNVDLFTDVLGRHETEPDFLDALGRLQLDLGPRATVAAGYLLLDDTLTANLDDTAERGNIDYRDATGWAAWTFHPTGASELRATLSRTERHTDRDGSVDQPASAQGTVDDRRRFDTDTVRLDASARVRAWLALSGGLEGYDYNALYRYQSQVQFNATAAAAFSRADTYAQSTDLHVRGESYAAYASSLISLSKRTTLDLALRWDEQRFTAAFHDNQLSPRLSLQYQYDPATALRVSWGRFAQTERPDELQVQDGDTTFHPAQRATQTVVSIERRIATAALLRLEAYDKQVSDPTPLYENLLDPFALFPELQVDRVRVQPDSSRMSGAELSVRWQLPQVWSGWASYTWSQATDRFGPVHVLRTWDQKHAISSGLAWTNRPWQVTTSLTWHTGWRRNELVATPAGFELAPRNAQAWPAYLSLDVRAAWTHPLPTGVLQAFGEIDNLTNHSNLCCSSYRVADSGSGLAPLPEVSTWLPRVFLVGVTWQLP